LPDRKYAGVYSLGSLDRVSPDLYLRTAKALQSECCDFVHNLFGGYNGYHYPSSVLQHAFGETWIGE